MERLEVRKNKSNYEVNVYYGKRDKAVYHNIIDGDPAKIAMILDDLEVTSSLPILKAVRIYLERRLNKKDWLGL